MRQYLKKYQVAGKTFEELMMEGLRPQTAVQDNTYVTNPRIEEARRDEREGMTPAKKTQAAAAKKKRIAEEKRQELVNAAANQGTISADTQSDFDKNIQRAYYIASNPMSALGHYAKYGYVPQGNLGNYGQRFDQSPMEMIVNGVNPFSWANAGYRFTNGLLNSESYDGLNASLDLIESMPMLGMMKSALPVAQNAIQNTYRLLPEGTFKNYSKLSNADKSYRVAGMDAYDDFLENHIVRSVTPPPKPGMSFEERIMSQRTTGFPSFQKGYADLNYLPESGKGVVFETSLPTYKRGQINPVTGTPIKGRHYAHRVIDPNTGHTMTSIPAEDIRAFGVEPHWLKGYPLLTDGKTLASTSQLPEGITPAGISGFRNFRGIDIPIEDFKLGFPYVDSEGKTIPVKDLQDFLSRDKAISNLSWSQMTGTPIDETASSGFQNSRGIDIPIKDFRLGFPYRGHRGIDIPLQDLQSFLSRDEAISNAEWERMVRNNTKKNGGEMIKRADGSYSQRGFWDNIRANIGSGKEPTKQMRDTEEKLNSKADGGEMNYEKRNTLLRYAVGGKSVDDKCPDGHYWDNKLKQCIPFAEGVPSMEQIMRDPILKDYLDKLNYKQNVLDYRQFRDNKWDELIKNYYKGPVEKDHRGLDSPTDEGYEEFKKSKEYQDFLQNYPHPDKQHDGFNLPEIYQQKNYYPEDGNWDENSKKQFDKFFGPAEDYKIEQWKMDQYFKMHPEEKGEDWYNEEKMMYFKNNVPNTDPIKLKKMDQYDMLQEKYDDWCPCSKMKQVIVAGISTMQKVCVPCEEAQSLDVSIMKDGGIHIDPSKKGTFKAQATRMNMGVQEAASHILANKEDYSPEMVKKAVFAHNFANQYGGLVDEELIGYEMGGGVEALEKFFGGGLNFKDNPELSYGKLDNYYKAGDKVDYKIENNLLQNLEPTKFNRTAAGLSGLAAPNSFAQYLPNQGLGSKLKGWMGLLGAAGSLGLAGSKLANLGNNTKVESNLYNDTTKESGATKDILQARLNASGDKSTTPKFSMTNFASQINDMEKEKMKNFQNTPENNSENYKQFMPQLNFKPEADESQKQTNNGEFPQDLLRKQTPNILSPDFNGSIETTPSTLQYNQFIPQAAFDSRYPDKIMPVQSFSQPIPAGVGPQRNQSILSTDYDGSSFENSGQETYNRNTYPNPSYTPAMLQNIIDNIQTKKDGGLTKFFPGGPFPGNPFAGNPLQATFNAQGIGTSGMGNTITGGNYMDFNGISPEQVRETAPIAIPQNNQTNQTITPTTYNTTYMDPVGMRAANNFLTGLGMFNQSPIGERQNILNEQRNFRDSGNTDSMAPVNNPQNPFGVFTPNAGPGINNNLVSRPAVQDFGTKGNFAKCGGQKMYREGGSYMLTKDQILNILANGGEIEFM